MSKYIVVSGTDTKNVLLITDDLQEAVIKRGLVDRKIVFNDKIYKLIDVKIEENSDD